MASMRIASMRMIGRVEGEEWWVGMKQKQRGTEENNNNKNRYMKMKMNVNTDK
jgi:hypothetical protein